MPLEGRSVLGSRRSEHVGVCYFPVRLSIPTAGPDVGDGPKLGIGISP